MTCECINMAGYGPDSWGKHHHVSCSKYETEKHPYLFYYEDAVNAWIPAPDKVENMISASDQLDDKEEIEIKFQRVDMTDKQIQELPVE